MMETATKGKNKANFMTKPNQQPILDTVQNFKKNTGFYYYSFFF